MYRNGIVDRHTALRTLLVGVLLILTTAMFATGSVEVIQGPPVHELTHENNMRLSDLFAMPVTMPDEGRVATVVDVVVDIGAGSLGYVVVQFSDDTYRDPSDRVPIPGYAFLPAEDGRSLSLLVDDTTLLSGMPSQEEIQRSQAPETGRAWERWSGTYWTTPPAMQATVLRSRRDQWTAYQYRYSTGPRITPVAMIAGTELVGYPVQDIDGTRIGTITDAVVNVENGHLLLLNMQPDERVEAEFSDYLAPLPAFTANRETGRLVYDRDQYGLSGPSAFSGSWPDLTSDAFHRRLARFWNEETAGVRYGVGARMVPMRMASASMLLGYNVSTREGRTLGTVSDLIITPDGTVSYVVFDFGDVLGFGAERSAVPAQLVTVQPIGQSAVLGVREADMPTIPRIDAGLLPDTSQEGWDSALRKYWSELYTIEAPGSISDQIPTIRRTSRLGEGDPLPLSALQSATVVTEDAGETIGSVNAVYLDIVAGTVSFLVVTVEGTGLFGADVPVPFAAVSWSGAADQPQLTVSVNRDELSEAPGYDDVPTVPNQEFIERLAEYWL
jgi:sporulation protein YlmC with PRC-barrel domain